MVQFGLIEANALWWELATLVTIMFLGHWIEMRSINQAEGALKELAKLLPDTATRITDGVEEKVAVSALENGDLLLVRPGETFRDQSPSATWTSVMSARRTRCASSSVIAAVLGRI